MRMPAALRAFISGDDRRLETWRTGMAERVGTVQAQDSSTQLTTNLEDVRDVALVHNELGHSSLSSTAQRGGRGSNTLTISAQPHRVGALPRGASEPHNLPRENHVRDTTHLRNDALPLE